MPPIHASASIWNGSHGPIPPVTMADTAIEHRPSSRPKRGPNAAPASTTRKKIPLPPPGRSNRRSRPARRRQHPEDRDRRAVHRAAPHLQRDGDDHERADQRRDERRVAAVRLARERGRGQPERVEERRRAHHDHERVDEERSRVLRHRRFATSRSTSSTVRNGGSTRSTCGANSDPASTWRALPSATISPSPSTTARVAQRGGELDVVGCEHHRAAGLGVQPDRPVECEPGRGVHATRGLVEQEHRRAADRHRRDRDALALAARQAPRVARREVVQAERVEPAVDVAVVARAEQLQRLLDLTADGWLEQQRVRVLGDVRGACAVGERDRARRRIEQPRHELQQAWSCPSRCGRAARRRRRDGRRRRRRAARRAHRARRARRAPRAGLHPERRLAASTGSGRSTGDRAAHPRASRTVSGGGSQPSTRPSRVTLGAPG